MNLDAVVGNEDAVRNAICRRTALNSWSGR
jgi:hypothetical protein